MRRCLAEAQVADRVRKLRRVRRVHEARWPGPVILDRIRETLAHVTTPSGRAVGEAPQAPLPAGAAPRVRVLAQVCAFAVCRRIRLRGARRTDPPPALGQGL